METNKIKVLLTAVKTGSLVKTADELGYTPSGVAYMMNSLEQELDVTLLHRSPAGIAPTAQCRQLLPAFRNLAEADGRITAELELARRQKKRLIRLGILSSASRNMVPRLIKDYTRLYPDSSFQISVGSRAEILDWLSSEKVDIGICSETKGANFKFYPIKKDPFYAVLPVTNPKARWDKVSIEDLKNETFLLSSYGTDVDFSQEIRTHVEDAHIMLMQMDDPAVLSMVSCGLGVSFLSDLMIEGYESDVALLPLLPPMERTIGIALYSEAAPDKYIRDFIALARKTF